jgi:hypothetical protein
MSAPMTKEEVIATGDVADRVNAKFFASDKVRT